MILAELFDTKVPWTEKDKGNDYISYVTWIDGERIEIQYETFVNIVNVEFSRNHAYDITNQGLEHKIFGAVINHVLDYIKKEKPQMLSFVASHNLQSRVNKRANLYHHMIKRFADKHGYTMYETRIEPEVTKFILARKKEKSVFVKEAEYPGNLGFMELIKFYKIATPEQASLLKELISQNNSQEAWRLVQDVTKMRLHGKD